MREPASTISSFATIFWSTGYPRQPINTSCTSAQFFHPPEDVISLCRPQTKGKTVLENLPDDPVKGVLALLKTYLKVYDYIIYAEMQEFIIQIKTNRPLHDISEWSIKWQRDQVKVVLDTAKASSLSHPSCVPRAGCHAQSQDIVCHQSAI